MILHTSYIDLCDYKFVEGGCLPPNKSIVHCHLDEIAEFFDLISETDNEYIVVSSNSDYSISYQSEQNSELKMKRWLKFIDTKDLRYNSMVIPARCNIEQCRITDRYCIDMYSWIKDTFNKIPNNVKKWYCTNNQIDSDIVTSIPFGIPSWSEKLISNYPVKLKTLYVNFMMNTVERGNLMNYYKSVAHNDLVCERDVSHERYCQMIGQSKFVLCPQGNGLDSYRILESLYSGAIPIVEKSKWIKAYDFLPVLPVDSLYLNIDELNEIYDNLNKTANWNFTDTRADINFWSKEFHQMRKIFS